MSSSMQGPAAQGRVLAFPAPRAGGAAPCAEMPVFTWEQLERQLIVLMAQPEREELARRLVSLVRKKSYRTAPEQVLREILCLSWTMLEEPSPASSAGTGATS